MSERNWCPTCRETTGLTERGVCQWCDTPLRHKAGRKPGSGSKITKEQLRVLHVAHVQHDRSINELAKSIYAKAGYKSHHGCAVAISNGWKRLGLQARDRIEMTVLKSFKHGRAGRAQQREHGPDYAAYRREQKRNNGEVHGRRCEGVRAWPPRKGQPCSRSALWDSEFCYQHDPRNKEQIESHLEYARSRIAA
jgi:hypothetical protein